MGLEGCCFLSLDWLPDEPDKITAIAGVRGADSVPAPIGGGGGAGYRMRMPTD